MNGPKNVVANFTQNQYTLTVNIAPSGSGLVTKVPDKTTYVYGDVVTLTATANAGYTFSNWSGDATGSTNPVTVTINGNKNVTANFTQNQYTLAVNIAPSGSGLVTKVPDKTTYVYGDVVTLTATGNAGYTFSNWSGDATGSTNPVSLTINGNKNVTANFTQNQYTLTANIAPSDSGLVTKVPDKTTYVYGEQVTLTAAAASGYTFKDWSGGLTGVQNPATITMNGPKNITATFSIGNGTATRDLPDSYTPSAPSTVVITVTPGGTTQSYRVEDVPPNGWSATDINENGQWDSVNKKVKWGPFFDASNRTLSYKATPPGWETGTNTFSGTATFDESNVLIGGDQTILTSKAAGVISLPWTGQSKCYSNTDC